MARNDTQPTRKTTDGERRTTRSRRFRPPDRNRRRVSRTRKWIWGAEALLLAVVLAWYGISRSRTAAPPVPLLIRPASPSPPGPPVPVLGKRARALVGLREVTDARLAPLEGLAPGSAAARAAQVDFSRRHGLPIEVVDRIGIKYRLLPPGTFLMGSPSSEPGHWDGEIQHVAVVPRPLYMSSTEITQKQWRRVFPDAPAPGGFHGPERPVEEVTWYDAVRFTRKLSEIHKVPVGTFRLPAEIEWEYACRAGTRSAWCCGNDPAKLGDFADFVENNNFATNLVARRHPNAWGLYDMHGNVWEWCLDKYRPYPGSNEEFPENIRAWRVIRGGNWRDPAVNCRSANRCRLPPASHGNILGFRIVRTLLPIELKQDDRKRPRSTHEGGGRTATTPPSRPD